jgi:hypothetical protein
MSSGKLWLRDFLPRHMPRAGIMSFGYDAAWRSHDADGFNGPRGPAKKLLDHLHEERRDGMVSVSHARATARALLTEATGRLVP